MEEQQSQHRTTSAGRLRFVLGEQATDVALPTEVPLVDLLPAILPQFGAECVEQAADHEGWVVQRLGEPPLDEDRTLAELNLLDGETVYLRPRADQLEAIAYDDLVEGVGEQVREHPGVWEAGHTRWMLRIGSIVALLAGLLLVTDVDSGVVRTVLAGTVALGLLAGSASVARGAANPPVATILAACGVGYATVTGWSLLGTLVPSAPAVVLLTGAALGAVLGIAAALAAVADAATLFAGALTFVLAVLIPGVIGSVSSVTPGQAAAIGLVVTVLAGAFVPTTAFRLSGLTLPMLPGGPQQLAEDIEPTPSEIVVDRGAATTAYSIALHVGLGAAQCLLLPALVLGGVGWQMVLALVVAFLLFLRTRHPNGVAQRWSLLVPAALCVVVYVLHVGGEQDLLTLLLAVFLPVLAAAAALAATEWTTIVAGGPGTGKTHTAARILALLYALHGPSLRVALAAPTGKAAARMQEAVSEQAADLALPHDLIATTLHRLLGWRRGNRSRFAHHQHRRLPHDAVIIDETSMVSLPLMTRLVEALRPDTRLILLGDPDQLASVDAGAVLADLVARPVTREVNADLARLADFDGAGDGEPLLSGQERERLRGAVVRLRRGHRFSGAIADLADAVRRGATDEAFTILHSADDSVRLHDVGDLDALRSDVTATGVALIDAGERDDTASALAALGQHRVLCAHREGLHGVQRWNRQAIEWTASSSGRPLDPDRGYPGQPLLVTETDYDAGIKNGDTGVVLRREQGLIAAFDTGVFVHPSRLSGVQTAYAMTIHRSQGSQYDTVSIVLPDETSAILTRQLLYTAITRARRRVRIIGSEVIVRAAIERQALRASGLSRTVE